MGIPVLRQECPLATCLQQHRKNKLRMDSQSFFILFLRMTPWLLCLVAALLIVATGRSKAAGKRLGIIGFLLLLGGNLISVASQLLTLYLRQETELTATEISRIASLFPLPSLIMNSIALLLLAIGLRRAMAASKPAL